MTVAPVRVGVVGCGYWGPKLARNLDALPGVELVAVADPSSDRRAHMAEGFPRARVLADHRALLDLGLDAVAIATPVATHAALATEALAAGCHVLVEKPLAASSAEARGLVAAAAAAGRVLMVGHTFAYHPAVAYIRDRIAEGHLGRLYYIDAVRANLGIVQPDVHVVWDLAPHDLTILELLAGGPPRAVRAHGVAHVRPDAPDVAWLTLAYPDGITAGVHLSWLAPSKTRQLTVVGDRRMLVFDDTQTLDKVRIFDRGIEAPPHTDSYGEFQLSYRYGDVFAPRLDGTEPLRRECAHFVACVRDGTTPATDGCAGLRVVEVLEAVDRSLASGGNWAPVAGA